MPPMTSWEALPMEVTGVIAEDVRDVFDGGGREWVFTCAACAFGSDEGEDEGEDYAEDGDADVLFELETEYKTAEECTGEYTARPEPPRNSTKCQ